MIVAFHTLKLETLVLQLLNITIDIIYIYSTYDITISMHTTSQCPMIMCTVEWMSLSCYSEYDGLPKALVF